MDKSLITIGWHKGECDFSVSAEIMELGPEYMNKLRAMTVVAIGTAEDMWRREQARKHELVASGQALP